MSNTEVFEEPYLLADFSVKIDGSPLRAEMISDILEIVVEDSLHMPAACTIRMFCWDVTKNEFRWTDDPKLSPGKKVEVSMGFINKLDKVFEGETTALEMDAAGHMVPTLLLRAVDKGHRLHRNRRQETYQNVKDSDVVSTVAGRCGLQADADATSSVYEWICQNNQTDYEFLKMLGDRNGHRVFVEGEKLKFKKVKDPAGPDVTVAWGLDLRSFRPRLTSHGQVSEVTVRGWDPKKKQPIVGKAQHTNAVKSREIGESKTGFSLANPFGDAKTMIVDWPIHSQKEAEDLAKSYIDKRESSSIEADGLCTGNNKIKAGKTVKVKDVGQRFSGAYMVTSSTHTFTPAEGYTTQFVCSGKDPHTVLGLLSGEKGDQGNMGGNIVVALVTNNVDPENKGRIKVKYPWLMENQESFWIRIATPMAGPDRGFYFLPEVNDEVLVAFEHGDIHRGYMIGALWNGVDNPVEPNDKAVVGNKVVHRVIKTRKGHIVMLQDTDNEEHVKITTQGNHYLILDDKSGAKKCEILTAYGHQILLDDQNRKITVKTKDGHKMEIDDPGKKIIVQDANGTEKMTIDAGANNISFECLNNFTVSAKGQVQIEGTAGVKVSSPATLNLSSTGPAELKSSAILTVQGSLVKIN